MRRREHLMRAGERDVDCQMVTAELEHPLARRRRLAQEGEVVLGTPETHTHRRLPRSRRLRLEHLIGVDDGHHLRVTLAAERGREQRQDGFLLRR
jgi:hypothetical protein